MTLGRPRPLAVGILSRPGTEHQRRRARALLEATAQQEGLSLVEVHDLAAAPASASASANGADLETLLLLHPQARTLLLIGPATRELLRLARLREAWLFSVPDPATRTRSQHSGSTAAAGAPEQAHRARREGFFLESTRPS